VWGGELLQQIKKLKINKNELNNLGHQYVALSLKCTKSMNESSQDDGGRCQWLNGDWVSSGRFRYSSLINCRIIHVLHDA